MRVVAIYRGNLEIERIALSRPLVTVGRSPTNDVVLRAPGVAPLHFLVEWIGAGTFDPSQDQWSIVNISKPSEDGNAGFLLSKEAVVVDGFRFEIREDKLEAAEIGGRISEKLHGEYSSPIAGRSVQDLLLEVMQVRRDSGALEEVRHLQPTQVNNLREVLAKIPEFSLRWENGALRAVLTNMVGAGVFSRGQKLNPMGSFAIDAQDFFLIQWKEYNIYLRYVEKQKVPLVPRTVILDPLLKKLVGAAAGLYALVFLLVFATANKEEPPVPKPPRVAMVEIKKAAEPEPPPPPPPPPEPTPPPKPEVAKVKKGMENIPNNPKPGQASAAKFVKDPNVKNNKIGLNNPSQVTNTNAIGLLGAFGKGKQGPGVRADKILNQGLLTNAVATNDGSAQIVIKDPPSGVLGTGNGGNPRARKGSDELMGASTKFAGGDKYDPSKAGPVSREGATGSGSELGSALRGGGSGLSGGRERGEDMGSLDSGKFSVDGGLDANTVKKVIDQYKGMVGVCYDRALLGSPGLNGRIVYRWKISPQGPVVSVSLERTTANNPSLENCVKDVIKDMKFPAAANGKATVVKYPYVFQPRN